MLELDSKDPRYGDFMFTDATPAEMRQIRRAITERARGRVPAPRQAPDPAIENFRPSDPGCQAGARLHR